MVKMVSIQSDFNNFAIFAKSFASYRALLILTTNSLRTFISVVYGWLSIFIGVKRLLFFPESVDEHEQFAFHCDDCHLLRGGMFLFDPLVEIH